jgi:hypothetical protein
LLARAWVLAAEGRAEKQRTWQAKRSTGSGTLQQLPKNAKPVSSVSSRDPRSFGPRGHASAGINPRRRFAASLDWLFAGRATSRAQTRAAGECRMRRTRGCRGLPVIYLSHNPVHGLLLRNVAPMPEVLESYTKCISQQPANRCGRWKTLIQRLSANYSKNHQSNFQRISDV